LGGLGAEQAFHHMQRAIDARADSRGGENVSVVDETLGLEHFRSWREAAEQLEAAMVRGGAQPVEQARLRQHERARAHAHDEFRVFRFQTQPLEQRWLVQQGARAEATRHNQDVRRWAFFAGEMRHHLQPIAGANRADVLRDRENIEHRVAAQLVGDRENLVGPGEVEHFNVVEQKDGDVLFHTRWGAAAVTALSVEPLARSAVAASSL
jgi:hypothetical protein